jgi:hypothetical protein
MSAGTNPLFENRAEYERFLLDGILRLNKLMAAVLLWLMALTLLLLALIALWALGVTGTEAAVALRHAWHSNTAQVLTAVGFSVLSLVGAGIWITRRLHAWLGKRVLLRYLAGRQRA